jgi:hypothetical protein
MELTRRTVCFFAARQSAYAIALAALVVAGTALPAEARRHRHEERAQSFPSRL